MCYNKFTKKSEQKSPLFNIVEEYMEERIRELLEGVIEENGYSLYKVEYVKENNMMFLRLYIDKDGIMEVEDCVTVSNLVNPILDEVDPIDESYILDVCSKGEGD